MRALALLFVVALCAAGCGGSKSKYYQQGQADAPGFALRSDCTNSAELNEQFLDWTISQGQQYIDGCQHAWESR